MKFWQQPLLTLKQLIKGRVPQLREVRHWPSQALNREVSLDIYLPTDYAKYPQRQYPLVIFNDGQDLPKMQFREILAKLYRKKYIPELIVVGIHASSERIHEYGTAYTADYMGRGAKAGHYKQFITNELLPYLSNKFRVNSQTRQTVFAGFSLGGLSAFDIAYDLPHIFGVVGVFSGSFWWRAYPSPPNDPDAGRIMLGIVQSGRNWDGSQRFWMQCGGLDEQEDRNNNGVIDAIDDTRDILAALSNKGTEMHAMHYLELPNGRHDQATWAEAMPDFLKWAFSDQQNMD
jgi:enterochelin esterase-like enzyme